MNKKQLIAIFSEFRRRNIYLKKKLVKEGYSEVSEKIGQLKMVEIASPLRGSQ